MLPLLPRLSFCSGIHWRILAFGVLVFTLGSVRAALAQTEITMPAGVYNLDPRHTSILFKIDHLGFSHFTGRFDHVEGRFTYNPVALEQSTLDITVYTESVDTNDNELDAILRTENWFDTLKYPRATFHATEIKSTSSTTAKVTGDFTLHDKTSTVVLDVALVGTGALPFSDTKVMGFSAKGNFERSAYGINNLEPLIGDDVALQIETEFDQEL